eukprot:4839345-Lingulodinium_polyedra.AAC.1
MQRGRAGAPITQMNVPRALDNATLRAAAQRARRPRRRNDGGTQKPLSHGGGGGRPPGARG